MFLSGTFYIFQEDIAPALIGDYCADVFNHTNYVELE